MRKLMIMNWFVNFRVGKPGGLRTLGDFRCRWRPLSLVAVFLTLLVLVAVVPATLPDGASASSSYAFVSNTVTDEEEPPAAPAAPTAAATAGSSTSLDVSWTAPDNVGKPPITSYDLRYRVSGAGDWTDGPQGATGTGVAIDELTANTEYNVQVRAINDEGDGAWSPSGTGRASP